MDFITINTLTEKDITDINDTYKLKKLLNDSIKKIKKLNNKKNKLKSEINDINHEANNLWINRIDYDTVNNYILNLFVNIDYDCSAELCNMEIENYKDTIKVFNYSYDLISVHKSGRYSDTYIIKNKKDNTEYILRNTIIKSHKQFIEVFKEIFIQKYCNKQLNIAPKIYNLKLLNKDNKIYLSIIMKRLKVTFFKHFKITKVYKSFTEKDSGLFNDFNSILPTLVGNVEYIIDNGISHNDTHDENICFDYDGKMYIIDYDNAIVLDNNDDLKKSKIKALLNDLKHFVKTYFYFKCFSVYDKNSMYELYSNTFLKKVIDDINNNDYVFGECIKYKDCKIIY
tara:strand:- start:327 stop:1349 length:1023 start_codon:yes stop_codon:yes gene_type:complete